jgi:glycosyltransferase involved in cell wall biosynthesis
MKTICLNMIVKNESRVIRRCLASVIGIIDYWVIVDTGSNDGTQKIIEEYLQGIPGELHEQRWVDFQHNRNAALDLARNKADYFLFIDADEILEMSNPLDKTKLDQESYFVMIKSHSVDSRRILLIDNDPFWRWKDVLHEYIFNPHQKTGAFLDGASLDCTAKDGYRGQDPEKALKDAQILERALQNEPENSRYVFYLAQSYSNAKNFPLALKYYEKRASMAGEEEEVFWSLYSIGCLDEILQKKPATIIEAYTAAYRMNPSRAEPLYRLAAYFQTIGAPLLGYLVAREALPLLSTPPHFMKTQKEIYDFELLRKFAELASIAGSREEALSAYRELLSKKDLPSSIRKALENSIPPS